MGIRYHRDDVVALRKESVDRNYGSDLHYSDGVVSLSARRAWIEMPAGVISCNTRPVALRKESVDRNMGRPRPDFAGRVALRKESVDRNNVFIPQGHKGFPSLSARRAWIEMQICQKTA